MKKDEILQIKIELDGIEPSIWRRFHVERNISFHQLHKVIQAVMGWSDYHLYSFKVGDDEYQDEKIEDFYDMGDDLLPARKTKIDMLKAKQKILYTYDFGDTWEHFLTIEKMLPKDSSMRYPVCLEGERNCPPEDCGNAPGYYHLMKVRKNKKHPEYKSLIKDWLGEGYDTEHFNTQEVNIRLWKQFAKKVDKKIDGRTKYWVVKK